MNTSSSDIINLSPTSASITADKSTIIGALAKFSAVSDASTSCVHYFSSPPATSGTSSALSGPPPGNSKDDNKLGSALATPSPIQAAATNSMTAAATNRNIGGTVSSSSSSSTQLSLLANLASAILNESAKKNKKRKHQENEAGTNNDDHRFGIRMPAVSAKLASSLAVAAGITGGIGTNVAVATSVVGDTKDGTTLISSSIASSTSHSKKVRPTSLWTKNSADSGVNAMHCFMLKELLEVVYEPKPASWADGGTGGTGKPGYKPTTSVKTLTTSNDDDDDDTGATSGEPEGRTKRRRTLTPKAREGYLFVEEEEEKEAGAAAQTMDADAGIGGVGDIGNDEQEGVKPKRKFTNKLTPKNLSPDGKAVLLCSDVSIVNQACIRCKFCKQTKGAGIIRPPSLEEGHWYIKIIRMENYHFANKCPKAPRELLDKLQALKKERKRGLKRSWKANALMQGLVTVVNAAGEPIGVSLRE